MASKHNTSKSNGRRTQSAPRQKLLWAIFAPEGWHIRTALMSRTQAKQQNAYYKKHGSVYEWKLVSAYMHEVFIGKLAA